MHLHALDKQCYFYNECYNFFSGSQQSRADVKSLAEYSKQNHTFPA